VHRIPGPEDANALWIRCMRTGAFEEAWKISDQLRSNREDCDHARTPRHLQQVWTGAPIEGKRVLIRCYHGLGDTIQFIRYAPMVARRAAELLVWAQAPLVPLVRAMPGVARVLPLHDGDPGVDAEVDVEVMELPYVFRTTVRTIPSHVPYLECDAGTLSRECGPAVGLVWKAGQWSAARSIPFAALRPLFDAPVTWYVLQGRPGIDECPADFGIAAGTDSVMDAARAARGLDLLITIDSMPAHLAGALGVEVWTLLPAEADWRWMESGERTPWYPTMRLFRQERPGEWGTVVERVAAALHRWAARRHTSARSAALARAVTPERSSPY
jgi:hypothetical protein